MATSDARSQQTTVLSLTDNIIPHIVNPESSTPSTTHPSTIPSTTPTAIGILNGLTSQGTRDNAPTTSLSPATSESINHAPLESMLDIKDNWPIPVPPESMAPSSARSPSSEASIAQTKSSPPSASVLDPDLLPQPFTQQKEQSVNSETFSSRTRRQGSLSTSRESTPLSATDVEPGEAGNGVVVGGKKRPARRESETGVRKKIKSSDAADADVELMPGKRKEKDKPERIKEDILSAHYDEPGKRKSLERIGTPSSTNRAVGVETRKGSAKKDEASSTKDHAGRLTKRKFVPYPVLDDKTNNDYCETCHGVGHFICCDSCPRSFHFSCVEPPMTAVEAAALDNWYCNACRAEKKSPAKSPKGIFQKLIDNINRRNPTVFVLPKEIKEYFKGVGANTVGDYVDSLETKQLKIGKTGVVEEPDYMRLKSKTGNPILCYKCGKSALHGMTIPCDHCILYWHMDCLSPPMINPPSAGRKWMCPNHADHVTPKTRKRKHSTIVTPTNPCGTKNGGDIEIINEDDKGLRTEEYNWGGVTYRLPEKAVKFDFLNAVRRRGNPRQSPLATRASVTLPPSSPVPSSPLSSVSSISSTTLSLSSLPADGDATGDQKELLEEDETMKVEMNEEETPFNPKGASRDEIAEWLSGLSAFQEDIASHLRGQYASGTIDDRNETDDYNLRQLIRAAIGAESPPHQSNGVPQSPPPTNTEINGALEQDVGLPLVLKASDPRYQQLLAVQKLMKVKGEDAMLAFLRGEGG